MKTIFTLFSLTFLHLAQAQVLNFSNQALEQYLLNEKSVDMTGDGFGDTVVDVNNDGKIQLQEALNVRSLVVFPSEMYKISEVSELHQFSNLDSLKIGGGGFKLKDVSNLALDSLSYIRVTDISDMDKVDLSDLPKLKSIYLEGLYRLKYLNLKNGSMAQNFSLFYTDVETACVDSIKNEYEVVKDHLSPTGTINLECTLGLLEKELKDFKIYPNPFINHLFIECNADDYTVFLYDVHGRLLSSNRNSNYVDVAHLNKGMYFILILTGTERRKVMVNKM